MSLGAFRPSDCIVDFSASGVQPCELTALLDIAGEASDQSMGRCGRRRARAQRPAARAAARAAARQQRPRRCRRCRHCAGQGRAWRHPQPGLQVSFCMPVMSSATHELPAWMCCFGNGWHNGRQSHTRTTSAASLCAQYGRLDASALMPRQAVHGAASHNFTQAAAAHALLSKPLLSVLGLQSSRC